MSDRREGELPGAMAPVRLQKHHGAVRCDAGAQATLARGGRLVGRQDAALRRSALNLTGDVRRVLDMTSSNGISRRSAPDAAAFSPIKVWPVPRMIDSVAGRTGVAKEPMCLR